MKRSGFKRGRPWGDRHEVTRKARLPAPLVPKATGKSAVAKGPIRDRAHRARVASHPCLICGMTLVQAHHLRECFPRTMGVRIGDDKVVPLCSAHHAELHLVNHERFWARHHINARAIAKALYAETLRLRERERCYDLLHPRDS